MIRAMGRYLVRLLPERENALPLVVFVLEAGLVAAFLFGLGKTVIGFDAWAFLITACLAVLMPRLAALRPGKRWSAGISMLAAGMGVVIVTTLRMWNLVLRLVLNFSSSGIYLGLDNRLARYVDQADIYGRIGERFQVLGTNLPVWFKYMSRGESIQVSQVTQLFWGTVIFVILLWTGWNLHLRRRPFLAVVPSIVVLGVNSELANYPLHFFGILFALGLIIVVVSTHQAREQTWADLGIGYSLDIRMDLWGVAAIFCIAAFLVSVFPPDLSIRTALERMKAIGNQPEPSIDLASGLGLAEQYPDPDDSDSGGRLPSSHLISAPPEQLETHLFDVWVGDQSPVFSANWRTHTFQIYTGHGWLAGDTFPRAFAADEVVLSEFPTGQVTRRLVVWERSDLVEGELIHAHQLVSVDQPVEILWRDNSTDRRDYSLGLVGVPRYTVQVSMPVTTIQDLNSSGFDYPDWIFSRYLQLPESVPAEVINLAAEFSQLHPEPYTRARAIESYLRQFPYNLDVPIPPADQDVVSYFLFDLKQGYCDYYATSMAVLARSAGLPARVVGGYSTGEYLADEGLYRVTAAEAHTWVEIYFAEIGWVEFEPTPSRPLQNHEIQAVGEVDTLDLQDGGVVPIVPVSRKVLLWVGGFLLVPLLAFFGWQRIRFLLLSRSELLIRVRDRLFEASSLLGISSPHCLTLRENLSHIQIAVNTIFSSRISRRLALKTGQTIQPLVRKLEHVSYGGISPGQMKKNLLVADLVRVEREIRKIKVAKMLQKPSSK